MRDLTLRSLPEQVRARLAGVDLRASHLAARSGSLVVEARQHSGGIEARSNGDAVGVVGYATSFDVPYDVYGGADRGGWSEVFAAGSLTKTLSERDDVRFLLNHEGLPLARTKSGTLRLSADNVGLLSDVPSLDMVNPRAVELVSALNRRDVDQMSLAFIATRQEWNSDYTERIIREAQLFDVSAVTYPANPNTTIGLRADEVDEIAGGGYPVGLAYAELEALSL